MLKDFQGGDSLYAMRRGAVHPVEAHHDQSTSARPQMRSHDDFDSDEAVRVMKAFAIFGMLCILSQPATAITCDQVRSYVSAYGVAAALSYAKKIGATAEQIRDARSCLLRASKDQPWSGRTREVFAR